MTAETRTTDTLLGGQVRLQQPADGYRAAIDPVLLAAAVEALPGERLLELGCGAGAASLCLAWRLPEVVITGLDLQAALVDLARSNAVANGFGDRLRFLAGDLRRPPEEVVVGGFDQIFANPPFLEAGRGTPPRSDVARISELEGAAALDDWLDAMLNLVRLKGRLTLIHRADRVGDILDGLRGRAGDIRLFPLWPVAGTGAKRIIVAARRGVRSPMQLKPGLTLHNSNGEYTQEVDSILRRGRQLAGVWA